MAGGALVREQDFKEGVIINTNYKFKEVHYAKR